MNRKRKREKYGTITEKEETSTAATYMY